MCAFAEPSPQSPAAEPGPGTPSNAPAHGQNADSPAGLVLASRSPQRVRLLNDWGIRFDAVPADVDESAGTRGMLPSDVAIFLARQKADVVARRDGRITLGADTVVAFGDEVLGKPRDADEAYEMLELLAGTTHLVITGIAVSHPATGFRRSRRVMTAVRMRPLTDADIRRYIDTGLWQGKAGGYGLQDEQSFPLSPSELRDPFVEKVDGDPFNVIGLPKDATFELLRQAGAISA